MATIITTVEGYCARCKHRWLPTYEQAAEFARYGTIPCPACHDGKGGKWTKETNA